MIYCLDIILPAPIFPYFMLISQRYNNPLIYMPFPCWFNSNPMSTSSSPSYHDWGLCRLYVADANLAPRPDHSACHALCRDFESRFQYHSRCRVQTTSKSQLRVLYLIDWLAALHRSCALLLYMFQDRAAVTPCVYLMRKRKSRTARCVHI